MERLSTDDERGDGFDAGSFGFGDAVLGGAEVNDQNGMLTWNMKVEPKGIKKLGFSYTVKHPKDLPVVVE